VPSRFSPGSRNEADTHRTSIAVRKAIRDDHPVRQLAIRVAQLAATGLRTGFHTTPQGRTWTKPGAPPPNVAAPRGRLGCPSPCPPSSPGWVLWPPTAPQHLLLLPRPGRRSPRALHSRRAAAGPRRLRSTRCGRSCCCSPCARLVSPSSGTSRRRDFAPGASGPIEGPDGTGSAPRARRDSSGVMAPGGHRRDGGEHLHIHATVAGSGARPRAQRPAPKAGATSDPRNVAHLAPKSTISGQQPRAR
jgi:hypothetical protein